jgi:uncharacterized protein (TIGR03086 family)
MIDVLQTALTNTRRIVAEVRPEHLRRSTPCTRFDVEALLNHMVGGQRLLVQAADGPVDQPVDGRFPDQLGGDPAGAYERSSKEIVELFGDPGVLGRTFHLAVDVPGEQALGIALMEAVVHGWDLATAISVPTGIDPAIAEQLLAGARGFVTEQFRNPDGNPFAPEATAAADAGPEAQLVAFLGRHPTA